MKHDTFGIRRYAPCCYGGSNTRTAAAIALPNAVAAQTAPRTFVLVHGAWHGGWCWRRVSDRLARKGHKVYAPSLDRSCRSRASDLAAGEYHDAHHRHRQPDPLRGPARRRAGRPFLCRLLVISGVAEKSRDAIRSIVFLDAYVPQNGQSVLSLGSQGMRDNVNAAIKRGQTGMAPASAAYFSVNAKDRAYVDSKCTPQPVGTYGEAIVLTGAREKIAKKTYIRAKGWNAPGFDNVVTRLRSDPSWNLREIACGHDAMIDMPDRLTEMLIEAA